MMAKIIPFLTNHHAIVTYVCRRMANAALEIAEEYRLNPLFVEKFRTFAMTELMDVIPASFTMREAARLCEELYPIWRSDIAASVRKSRT